MSGSGISCKSAPRSRQTTMPAPNHSVFTGRMPFLPPNQQQQDWRYIVPLSKKVKVAHTQLRSVGFRSWYRFMATSLQVTWIINPVVSCHYYPPGLQLPPQSLRGLLPISLLGEQRHNGCKQFAKECYPTASRLRFEPGPFCAWVQHANHSATEPPPSKWPQKDQREERLNWLAGWWAGLENGTSSHKAS